MTLVSVNNTDIPFVSCVKFLGVLLDGKLNGTHLKFLTSKDFNITKLSHLWWGLRMFTPLFFFLFIVLCTKAPLNMKSQFLI